MYIQGKNQLERKKKNALRTDLDETLDTLGSVVFVFHQHRKFVRRKYVSATNSGRFEKVHEGHAWASTLFEQTRVKQTFFRVFLQWLIHRMFKLLGS